MRIPLSDVQRNIAEIANRAEYTPDVIYELLAAYGRSKSAITQLQTGHLNKAETGDAVLQKDVVYFRVFPEGTQLELQVQELAEDPLTERYKPRYLIATDLIELAAKDRVKGTTLTIKLADIDNELDFFYAWTGDEVVDTKTEAVADRRAADKMNELYVEIEKENREQFATNPSFRHELNVFFTRLLFCYFAEDTGIYADKQFTDAIKRFTQLDGSDLSWFFGELFKALDTKDHDKSSIMSPFKEFPYVNGSIFNTSKHAIGIPKFSAQARHLIIECGRQNWGEINPDIFGTMFQGVVDPDSRDENGMDYTSVPNIMKVIEPLFLDELREQFDKHYDNEKRLWALLNRISAIKIFDPACGSGNFLIIAYKELRQLQHAIIGRIDELKPGGLSGKLPSGNLLDVDHLYGIEIDDFARELAILSIFLAKHQMNMEFNKQFGTSLAIIPLIELNTIVHGNAARIDWQTVCPNVGRIPSRSEQESLFDFGEPEQVSLSIDDKVYDEIYLIGNPPYKGSGRQTPDHKADFRAYFGAEGYSGNLDYISLWFIKGSRYIAGTMAQLAFVSTNSICQGDHVGTMFPKIYSSGVEIGFAYTQFTWRNSARDNAGVTVIILNLRGKSKLPKYLYVNGIKTVAKNINGYLIDFPNILVNSVTSQISGLPKMRNGSEPNDGGSFMFTKQQKEEIVGRYPEAEILFKGYVGAQEFINGGERYCLWIDDTSKRELVDSMPELKQRIVGVEEHRSKSPAKNKDPYQFVSRSYTGKRSIIVPKTSSERREYIPMGYVDDNTVISNAARLIDGAEMWLLGLLQSKMNVLWVRTVGGKLREDTQYSVNICYNTLPVPLIDENHKDSLSKSARRILLSRAAHPEKTLATMYDPDKMPADLREAHEENDRIVDSLYKKSVFNNDEERLTALFELYEQMTPKEKSK